MARRQQEAISEFPEDRVIYTLEVKNKIYVLHCFKKQSAKTEKQDLDLAKSRLKEI